MLAVTLGLVVVLVTLLVLYIHRKQRYWRSKGIYSPPATFLLGHIPESLNKGGCHRFEFIDKVCRERREEKMFGIYEFCSPNLMVYDLELCQKIFIKDFDHFVDRRTVDMKGTDMEILSEMLTTATGNRWRTLRSIMTPTFTSGKMKNMFHLVQNKAAGLISYCRKNADANSVVECKAMFSRYTMDVIGSCAFGKEMNALNGGNTEFMDNAEKLFKFSSAQIFRNIVLAVSKPLYNFLKLKSISPAFRYLIDVVKSSIIVRHEGERREDFMDLMLDAQKSTANNDKEKSATSASITDDTIVASAVLFLLAGYDTTANTLCFVTHLLAGHPSCQDRLRDEISSRAQRNQDGRLTYQDIMESPYLDAVLSESLRLYAPATFTERQCTKDYRIPGSSFTIPKGMVVTIPIYSFHHDERFFPNPKEFRPERFLPENKQSIPAGAYLPFGAGPRMCIAQRFALMEAKLAIGELLLHYHLKLPPGGEQLQLDLKPGTLRPVDGTLKVILTDLKSQQHKEE